MPRFLTTALTGAALVLAAAAPAAAAPRGTNLQLTLTFPETNISATRTVVLKCDPPGGEHPKAAEACAELARSDGDIDHEPDAKIACTMEYAPVIAEAKGSWRGQPRAFRGEYPNNCSLRAHTGSVFAF